MECRLLPDQAGEQQQAQGGPTYSLFLTHAELREACLSAPQQHAATASLARKLLRLRAPCRERGLFSPLGEALGGEGLEQLCSFVAGSLREGRGRATIGAAGPLSQHIQEPVADLAPAGSSR